MASRAVRIPSARACLTLAAWYVAARGAAANRVASYADDYQGASAVGHGCLALKNLNKKEVLTGQPPAITLVLERRGLEEEYKALVDDLFRTNTGSLGAWKCSALYRAMYVRGHEEKFAEKGVAVYITKSQREAAGAAIMEGEIGSKVQVCFVDRKLEPTFMPPDVYTDGKGTLTFKEGQACSTLNCDRVLKPGVYGVIADNFDHVRADKSTMPVDLLKFLEKKGALMENVEMAALINIGAKTGFTAAQVVDSFREKFLAKGVNVFYCQKSFKQGSWVEWHFWFEYVDVEVVGEGYKPTDRYPSKVIELYNECKAGNPKRFTKHLTLMSGQKKWGQFGKCNFVAAAGDREGEKYPDCKCQHANARVFCGDQFAAGRKFNIEAVLASDMCKDDKPYCSIKPCELPVEP